MTLRTRAKVNLAKQVNKDNQVLRLAPKQAPKQALRVSLAQRVVQGKEHPLSYVGDPRRL